MHKFTCLRYSYDDPIRYGLSSQVDDSSDVNRGVYGDLLSHSVRIVPSLFPDLYEELKGLHERMMLDRSIDCFVTSNPEIQAYCIPFKRDDADHFAVVLTSALVERLKPEEIIHVIGHEVGHFIYQHWRHPKGDEEKTHGQKLAMLQLERAAEISADRVGMMACKSLEASCRAMIKVASGLSEPHLNPDIPSILRQFRELVSHDGHEAAILASHPIIPLRIRALLKFDPIMKEYLGEGSVNTEKLLEIDHSIDHDFHKSTGHVLSKIEDERLEDVKLWGMVSIFVADGVFSKSEQATFSDHYGADVLKKVKGYLNSNPKNINSMVSKRIEKACREAASSSLEKRQAVVNELHELFCIGDYQEDHEIDELEKIKEHLGFI